ncbi:unnamed protein product [Phytophthora fragariaefolia]|uniref:Unnamed protein product n=1 Tax=Phytophthora fragariaefolia TaxID=1490495 RepID=A0A9W6XLY8_9STRA|nr:unnamed protein product [Phytophthora fragariaefolia]
MEHSAAFVDAAYDAAKAHPTYQQHFAGKRVVVLDNAPPHSQTEELVREREDLMVLRLAPYSPMCNPIEGALHESIATLPYHLTTTPPGYTAGCFSVFKAAIKRYFALSHDDLLQAPRGQMSGLPIPLLHELHRSPSCEQDGSSLRPGNRHCEAR